MGLYLGSTPVRAAHKLYLGSSLVYSPFDPNSATSFELYQRLLQNTSLSPAFIECNSNTDFNAVNSAAPPAAGLPVDPIQEGIIIEYTVTGSVGSGSISVNSGNEAYGSGKWGAVIRHDDGTYGLYGIISMTGGVATIFPNLRSGVTAGVMRNFGPAANGQHLTEMGYQALARRVYAAANREAYRGYYARKFSAATDDGTQFSNVGANVKDVNSLNSSIASGKYIGTFIARSNRALRVQKWNAPRVGAGAAISHNLNGASGHFETFVARHESTGEISSSFKVSATDDGTEVFNTTYPANSGLQRVIIPFSEAGNIVVTVTMSDDSAGDLRIGDTTFWVYPNEFSPSEKVINKNSTVAIIGDSWTVFYPASPSGGALGAELQLAMTEDGGSGSVFGVGVGGTTSEWGLSEFDTRVAPLNPDAVLINFGINDLNAWGAANYDRWLKAMYHIGYKCQMIGARPVYIMPQATQSISQSASLRSWSERMAIGVSL